MTDKDKVVKSNFPGGSDVSHLGPQKKIQAIIHTMPKRFLNSSEKGAKEARGVGIIILAGGAVFLIAGFIFAYFYFISPEPNSESLVITPDRKAAESATTTPSLKEEDDSVETEKSTSSSESEDDEENNDDDLEPVIPEATTTKPEIIVPKPATTTKPAAAMSDSDKDGLSDREELLLGTKRNMADSDSDGYEDLSELGNLYNPAGEGKIIVNPGIKKFTNPSYRYVLYYPEVWPVSKVGNDDSVVFTMDNNQFIQIIVQANTEEQTLDEWYQKTFSVELVEPEQKIYKKGWDVIKGENDLVVYLRHPETPNIFTMTYNLGVVETLFYENIFTLMVNSLELSN